MTMLIELLDEFYASDAPVETRQLVGDACDQIKRLSAEIERRMSDDSLMQRRIDELKDENERLTRLATDRAYFMNAYRNMLGEAGLKVAEMWDAQGVKRVHSSWGTEAATLTGEQRAQCILDWENAPRQLVKNIDTDAPVSENI